jgi:hypothetical protein
MFSLGYILRASSENTQIHTSLPGFCHLWNGGGHAQQIV